MTRVLPSNLSHNGALDGLQLSRGIVNPLLSSWLLYHLMILQVYIFFILLKTYETQTRHWHVAYQTHLQSDVSVLHNLTLFSLTNSCFFSIISPYGKRIMSKLAQRMIDYVWFGVCPSSACKWDIIPINNLGNIDMRIMSRKIPDASG
jgi:hypothetical protein